MAETTQIFFRYRDGKGNAHIVDALSAVPKKFRARAERIEMTTQAAEEAAAEIGESVGEAAQELRDQAELQVYRATEATYGVVNRTPAGEWMRLPTWGGLSGLVVAAVAVVLLWRNKGSWWLKVALLVVAAGLLGGAYLGWIRQQAGLSNETMATPREIVQDAQEAVRQVQEQQERMQESLEQLKE